MDGMLLLYIKNFGKEMTKSAEKSWRRLAKHHGIFWHKYGDVRYCIHCKKPLPKAELKPDFVVAPIVTYVEAKNNDGTGTWKWTELQEGGSRENQRNFLKENNGWLFIELGEGNAPKNKQAWLIPWFIWEEELEPMLIDADQKSIRHKTKYNKDGEFRSGHVGGDLLFTAYALEWEPNTGWTVPRGHMWWRAMKSAFQAKMIELTEMT